MKKSWQCIHKIVFAISLAVIANTPAFADAPISADAGFIKVPHLPFNADGVSAIRFAALQEAANSLGARSGLAWQARNINFYLNNETIFLNQSFDFNQLLLDHNVLPPVLTEDNESMNVDNDDTLRIAQKTYRILRPARFVTAPPNWRNYLWMSYEQPTLSDRSLLPQTDAETTIWDHYFKKGWREGTEQANDIFTENLNHLKQDMIGMILYRKLLAENMVSAPFVAKAQLGVTGDASQLRINDEIMRITSQSALEPNPEKWKPVLAK